jgi:hypothetical protein
VPHIGDLFDGAQTACAVEMETKKCPREAGDTHCGRHPAKARALLSPGRTCPRTQLSQPAIRAIRVAAARRITGDGARGPLQQLDIGFMLARDMRVLEE